ncbi:SH3 domain-containing protein [Candidatus Leptofilum sp.]|uniref:SH3 domain-containing protein n=1 Tax=Candidatus Leptofilum sp. TaxID=3241576 RepID=UPI003B5BFA42
MPVQSVRMQRGDQFEELVFDQVGRALNKYREHYTIASAFYLDGKRQYDGLIISPQAIFTLEMKNASGSVHMGPNTPLVIKDEAGNTIEAFKNRHEDARTQADMQWRQLSDYFKDNYDNGSIFVKAVLVFPDNTKFYVPPEHRDFSDYRVTVLFATVSELPKLVQQMRPPYPISLDKSVQAIIMKGLREGVYTLSSQEKAKVANVVPPKRPSATTSPSQPKRSTPLRNSYDIARARSNNPPQSPPQRTAEAITPISTPPPPETDSYGRKRLSWFLLLLGFGAIYFLLSFVASTITSLAGAAIFTFFMSQNRRIMASLTIVAFFLGIMFFNGVNPFAILQNFLDPLPLFSNSEGRELPPTLEFAVEDDAENIESKEGNDTSAATAVPATPRLRVIGNSNVRSEPSLDGSLVGIAEEGTVYVILAETVDRSWYQIRLSDGTEGWIGSTRVERLSP